MAGGDEQGTAGDGKRAPTGDYEALSLSEFAEPLADLEFLARSENRVRVLGALADGPATRDELRDATGVERVTLGRILGDFELRGWIERDGVDCRATLVGRVLAREFGEVLTAFATTQQLGDVARWLPSEGLGFDVTRLADATVTVPDRTDPMAAARRSLQRLADAPEVTLLTDVLTPETLRLLHDRVVGEELCLVLVVERAAVEHTAATPELDGLLDDLLGSDDATLGLYDGQIPVTLALDEGTVDLLLTDDRGVAMALVETDDPEVREWADETVARYRTAADPVAEGSPVVDQGER
jgi:predicted transcriptional regulator